MNHTDVVVCLLFAILCRDQIQDFVKRCELYWSRRRAKVKTTLIGRIARLKSGGPEMTIVAEFAEQVVCEWETGRDRVDTALFHINSLDILP